MKNGRYIPASFPYDNFTCFWCDTKDIIFNSPTCYMGNSADWQVLYNTVNGFGINFCRGEKFFTYGFAKFRYMSGIIEF